MSYPTIGDKFVESLDAQADTRLPLQRYPALIGINAPPDGNVTHFDARRRQKERERIEKVAWVNASTKHRTFDTLGQALNLVSEVRSRPWLAELLASRQYGPSEFKESLDLRSHGLQRRASAEDGDSISLR